MGKIRSSDEVLKSITFPRLSRACDLQYSQTRSLVGYSFCPYLGWMTMGFRFLSLRQTHYCFSSGHSGLTITPAFIHPAISTWLSIPDQGLERSFAALNRCQHIFISGGRCCPRSVSDCPHSRRPRPQRLYRVQRW